MKLSHLSILFVAIFVMIIISTDIRTEDLTVITAAKNDMDFIMDQAVESAVEALKQMESETISVSELDDAAESFYSSMYASLGILSDPVAQEKFRAYVPVIAITTEKGYFLMYNDEYTGSDGYTYISKRWTELRPYYFLDNDFIYRFTFSSRLSMYDINNLLKLSDNTKLYETTVEEIREGNAYLSLRTRRGGSFLLDQESFPLVRQQSIVNSLEKDMSWYISRHNQIASYYGITYRFALPLSSTSDWNKTIEGPGIIVVFQGMPLAEGTEKVYNRIAFSGAGVRKDGVYFIEQHSWYYIYHKKGCPRLEGNLNIRQEHYDSVEECSKLGCYACEYCDPVGVHAPDYDPSANH
ncbi:MAG TPA: hypothetical protein VJ888_05025 [Mobilitalea sp.]|nr:hypothetical protein [Mobilitalea sp.]